MILPRRMVKRLRIVYSCSSRTFIWTIGSGILSRWLVKGYVVKYSTKKKFGKKTTIIKKVKKATFTIKKLKANKNYYVKVRAYKVVNNKTYYGKWSNRKTVKVYKK